jgi:hypothetical protein
MTPVRRYLPAGVAVLLLALAAALILFAFDVRTWQSTLQRDDLRFRLKPDAAGLWRPTTVLPGDPAGLVLSTGDATRWRRALRSFWDARSNLTLQAQGDLPALRTVAQERLQELMTGAATAEERSAAANLLGVLVVAPAPPAEVTNQIVTPQILRQAIGYFQQAVALDPSNTQAKQNLELALRVPLPGRTPVRANVHTGASSRRRPSSTERLGNGY